MLNPPTTNGFPDQKFLSRLPYDLYEVFNSSEIDSMENKIEAAKTQALIKPNYKSVRVVKNSAGYYALYVKGQIDRNFDPYIS